MLLPSANNIADSLARWAFGSVQNYINYANQMVKTMGLTNTTIGDANGFSDTTTSTADDLVKLGIAALNQPILAQIANQSTAQVPVAGSIKSTNWLLGSNGVIGIKTGNTDKAGGCYLFAAERTISGHQIKMVGAVLNQPNLTAAISTAPDLLKAADNGFQQVTVLQKKYDVGSYTSAWSGFSSFRPASDLSLFVWKGQAIKLTSHPQSAIPPTKAGTIVGTVTAQSGQQTTKTNLVLVKDLPQPDLIWRFTRLNESK